MGIFHSNGWDPAKRIPDLNGKVAVVTGAKYVLLPNERDEEVPTKRVTNNATVLVLVMPQPSNLLVMVPRCI